MLLFALLGIVAVLLPGSRGTIVNPGLDYVFMLFWALLILSGPYLFARRQYKRQTYLREPMQYLFTNDQVRLKGPSFSCELSWSLVQRVRETQRMFLVYQSPQIAWLLPKRFFSDQASTEAWKSFVISRLSKQSLFSEPGFIGRLF
jgi:YcxB-like protein